VQVIKTIEGLRNARRNLAGAVGLVTTMGALHAGHVSLVEQARADNDAVIATIFVNPTQFAAHEDLAKYPRTLERDLDMLRKAGVDLVFTPTPDIIYPANFQTYVEVEQVSQGLEGAHRPNHFRGVATVVAKLFNLTLPDVAYFGQKDAQQVAVIRRMAHDLNFPLKIVVCPTLREPEGLAMSSRNQYLSPDERRAAAVLYRALHVAAEIYQSGGREPNLLRQTLRVTLSAEEMAEVDYVSAADARTLRELDSPTDGPMLLSLAVKIGTTRLIDNLLLPLSLNNRDDLTAALGAP
jgi:pantoate--beta-alanine ligase